MPSFSRSTSPSRCRPCTCRRSSAIWAPTSCRSSPLRRTPTSSRPTGQLTFVDNLVDTTTDTIKLKATFPNTDHRLWPGQFARVSLRLTTLSDATVVPSQAVQTGQDGQFVFVVKPDSTVEQRPVTVAQRVGDDVVIEKGLKPGRDDRHGRSAPAGAGHARARPAAATADAQAGVRAASDATGRGQRGAAR